MNLDELHQFCQEEQFKMYPEDDQQLVDGDQENLTEIFDNKSIEL